MPAARSPRFPALANRSHAGADDIQPIAYLARTETRSPSPKQAASRFACRVCQNESLVQRGRGSARAHTGYTRAKLRQIVHGDNYPPAQARLAPALANTSQGRAPNFGDTPEGGRSRPFEAFRSQTVTTPPARLDSEPVSGIPEKWHTGAASGAAKQSANVQPLTASTGRLVPFDTQPRVSLSASRGGPRAGAALRRAASSRSRLPTPPARGAPQDYPAD